MQVISLAESKRLTELEKIITNGQQAFIIVGTALAEIRDKKLYRATHNTFANYLDEEWNMGKAHGYRLIDASEAVKSLSPTMRQNVNLASASALFKVPPPKRPGIVSKIIQAGQKVTAAAVSKLAPKPRSVPAGTFLDGTGLEVPPEAVALYKRKEEVQALLNKITELRSALKAAQGDLDSDPPINPDCLYTEVDFTSASANLSQAWLDIKRGVPYAVCPSCNGVNAKDCETCNSRGMVSQWYWEKLVPKETKDLTGRK